MKFVMSYSCGKDSTLALHKMIAAGHEPVALLVMVNEDQERSFFHGADNEMLEAYSKALNLPLLLTPTKGDNYHLAMEESLKKAKVLGAEAACFGDIDLEGNRAWAEERCQNTGIDSVFPLWQNDRVQNVHELVDLGYKCLIKSLDNRILPETLLGKIIDNDTIKIMEECGIDICGENGEYHTLVIDGPVFKSQLPFETGKLLKFGDFSVIEVSAAGV